MVSIIIPVYGVEKYIERCAISILEQTYKDIEFVFVNDCTKDNSMHILQKIIDKYSHRNIIIVNKPKNEGLPQARKTGVLASHGDYIIHFDSDDWVEKDCIEKMYKVAIENSADIVISEYFKNYTDKEIRVQTIPFESGSVGIELMLRTKNHSGVWNKLVKRSLYEKIEFPIANMHEDLAIMVQLFSYANSISFIDSPFYHYNLSNQESISSLSKSRVKQTLDSYKNLKLIESFLREKELLHRYSASFSCFVNSFKIWMMMHKETRNTEWLYSLFPQSKDYIFSDTHVSFIKKVMLYGAFHNISFPYKIIDSLRLILR